MIDPDKVDLTRKLDMMFLNILALGLRTVAVLKRKVNTLRVVSFTCQIRATAKLVHVIIAKGKKKRNNISACPEPPKS